MEEKNEMKEMGMDMEWNSGMEWKENWNGWTEGMEWNGLE